MIEETRARKKCFEDILRHAIISKDSLDQLYNTLVHGPPLLTFQVVGRDVTFFLAIKIDNTIVHFHLSMLTYYRVRLRLIWIKISFHLFQVQTLNKVANERIENKREVLLQERFFPTLGTPEQNDPALKSSVAS